MLLTPFMFILVTLACFRVTRFLVHDSLMGSSLDSGSGWSQTLDRWAYTSRGEPKGFVRDKLAELLTCPYCLGFWISLAGTCIALRTFPWHLGIDGWFTAWAVAGAAAMIYQAMIKMMK